MKRATYQIPERSAKMLDEIQAFYGHGSKSSALSGCIQHVYMVMRATPLLNNVTQKNENDNETNTNDGGSHGGD